MINVRINYYKIPTLLFFLAYFATSTISWSEGFVDGTLVKTPHSYTPIEQLKENDLVISYNFQNAQINMSKITKIQKNSCNSIVQVQIQDQVIEAAPDHKFYYPLLPTAWVQAQNLQKDHFLLVGLERIERIGRDSFSR